MGRGALDRMVLASGISRDTLISYRNGRRTPPPDKIVALHKAADQLGASVELSRIAGKQVSVVATWIPELNAQQWWDGPSHWLNHPFPHHSHDARFRVSSIGPIVKWFHLRAVIANSPDVVSVAIFPRAHWSKTGSSWFYAILELARFHRTISGEFVVGRLKQERMIAGHGTSKSAIGTNDLILCQQIRHTPRSGSERQFRVVPAWPWPTNDDESEHSFEFDSFIVKLANFEPLYHGNLKLAADLAEKRE